MSGKNESEKNNQNKIPQKIINAISNLEPDYLIRSETYPFCSSDNNNIMEILEESNGKENKEDEKEYKVGNYQIKRTLGKGTFGKVKLGIYIPTNEKVAIKILEKSKIVEKDDEIRVKREFEMLTLFSHPNVILVAEIFESGGNFYSVMEYCEGGELFNYIVKNRRLSQDEAAFFYYQLINGLEYIHSLGIVHRDLKPENLLLTKDHILKIIDFGLSNYFKKDQKDLLITPCGSPCYASPEMVAGKKYNGFKIDIWSTGIILYAMLCGYLPFEDKDNDALFEKILECKLVFPKYIPKLGKNLIEKILVKNPNRRITIKEIKEHPFYLKGKELFEQEFSICQIENNMDEINTDDEINNIIDIHVLNYNNDSLNDDEKEIEGKNKIKNNEKINEKKMSKEKKKKIPKNRLLLNGLDAENFILRIKTEGDEEKQSLTLRNEYLNNLDKDMDGLLAKTNNHSSKKVVQNNDKNKNKNKKINNEKYPFKKRDIIYTKNQNKDIKREQGKNIKKEPNKTYRKLNKTNKYSNIKNQFPNKHMIGKSVNVRKINYKNKENNLIQQKNNFTNVIKSKFHSKEKIDKNNISKKENIYTNNINNLTNASNFNKKLKLKFNVGLYNSTEQSQKKNNSTAKKNLKLTTFQTIETEKNNKNYLDNLFNIQSNIKKYKQQLKDIKFNDEQKLKLRNTIDNASFENRKGHFKIKTDILSGEINKKINKDNIKLTKIYNNRIDNKKNLINIIDNTDEDENRNQIKQINVTLNTDREQNIIKKINNEQINNPKTNRDMPIKKKLMNLKYYMNEIEQNQTFRNERESLNKHKHGLKSDIIDSFEKRKISNFNLKKMLINDFNKKAKKDKKENILILENLTNDNINVNNLNTIDNINRTEPNQIIHITKKIIKKEPKDNNYKLSAERNHVKRRISSKISSNKYVHLNSNNLIKKQKINFNENKIIRQINNEKNLNKTSNDFNYINYSIMNQINSKYKNIFDMNLEQKSERKSKNIEKKFINIERNKNNKKILTNNDKKPCVTIKNTVINLNIDTGIIINPFDKNEKIKSINSKKISNYSISYERPNKNNNNNYIKNEKTISNISHHNTNEKPFQTINEHNKLLTLNEEINSSNRKLGKNIRVFKERNQMKIDNSNIINSNRIPNKSMNSKFKKHMKYNSVKIDENMWNKLNNKDSKNLYLKTNENFFKH